MKDFRVMVRSSKRGGPHILVCKCSLWSDSNPITPDVWYLREHRRVANQRNICPVFQRSKVNTSITSSFATDYLIHLICPIQTFKLLG